MNKTILGAAASLALLVTAAGPTLAANATREAFAPAKVKQVKPGVFMLTGNGSNSVVRVGKTGLILVDTKNDGGGIYEDLVKQIRTISPLPVKEVIVTHHHHPSSGNAELFAAKGAAVVGSENEAKELQLYNTTHKIAGPSVTFKTRLNRNVGGVSAVVYHFGGGHTGGDSVVLFPDVKVLAAGDLVVGYTTPHADFHGGGSMLGFVRSLNEIAKLDFDYVVPGDGDNLMTRAAFLVYKKKVETMVGRIQAAARTNPKDKLLASFKVTDIDAGWGVNDKTWEAPDQLNALYAEMSKK